MTEFGLQTNRGPQNEGLGWKTAAAARETRPPTVLARRIYDAIRDVLNIADNLAGELAEAVQAREEARFASVAGVIKALSAAGRLGRYPDMTVAHDLLWSLTGHELYRRLVVERGWSPDRYEVELGDLLIRSLLT